MTEQEIVEKIEAAAKELLAAKNENEQLRQALALSESQVAALAERRGGGGGASCSRCRSLEETLAAVIAIALFIAAVVSDVHDTNLDWFTTAGIGVLWVAAWVLAARFRRQIKEAWREVSK